MTHHGAALQKLINNDKKAEKILENIINNYKEADISDEVKEVLNYAEKLTKDPSSITKIDIQKLKDKGLSDKDILDLNQVVAYFNYVNRLADGLGIELEEIHKD